MQPMGRHKLSEIVSELLSQIGVSGKISNHSLRASAVTHLYQQDVDEQLIMEHTGHCSNAVRLYKHTSNGQIRDVSNILYSNVKENDREFASNKCAHTECNASDHKVSINLNPDIDNKKVPQIKDDGHIICVNLNLNFGK